MLCHGPGGGGGLCHDEDYAIITIPVFFYDQDAPPPPNRARQVHFRPRVPLVSTLKSFRVVCNGIAGKRYIPHPPLFRECVYQLFRGRQTPSPFHHLYVITNGHNVYSLNLEWAFC